MGRKIILGMAVLGLIVGIATASDTVDDRGLLLLVFVGAVLVMAATWFVTARRRRQRN